LQGYRRNGATEAISSSYGELISKPSGQCGFETEFYGKKTMGSSILTEMGTTALPSHRVNLTVQNDAPGKLPAL